MLYKDEEWLREAYEENTVEDMADMADCAPATISKYMNMYNIETDSTNNAKGGEHTDEDWLRGKYIDEKLSQKEIADIAGVHKGTIKYWLDKHDIEIRDKSDAAKIRAERYPNTWGTENIRDCNWWEDASEEERQAVREQLSEERTGEDNPMWNKTGEDHHRWKPDKPPRRLYASKAWEQARQKVLERDNHCCQACGMTEERHKEVFNQGIHVHHIQPVSAGGPKFDADNLVTLCNEHHHRYEGLYLRPDTRG